MQNITICEIMLACLWGSQSDQTPWRNYFKPEQSWTSNRFCNGSSSAQQEKAGVKPMLTSPGTGATISLITPPPHLCNYLPCPLRQAAKNSCSCKVTFVWHSLTPDTKPHNSKCAIFLNRNKQTPNPHNEPTFEKTEFLFSATQRRITHDLVYSKQLHL